MSIVLMKKISRLLANSYYTLQKHSLYTANDLKQIEYRDYRTSRNGDKEKGNAYYITTSTGAGWIDNNDNSLEVQEIHKLSNQKLIVKEEASIHALPFQSFKEEGKLEPQVITPTEQAGNWFKVQINETAKWIYTPSATFEGTKASLLKQSYC